MRSAAGRGDKEPTSRPVAPDSSRDSPSAPARHAGDRVPIRQKIAIGTGEIPTLGRRSIEQLALPIYHLTLGVSPVLVTAALALARFLDAFTDPLAGSISDNTRGRWGRRKPYLVASSIACGVAIPLVWMVPSGWNEMACFWYLLGSLFLYYVAYSFFNVPMVALAIEATPDYHERTRVAAYKSFFSYSMGLASSWLFALTQLKSFGGTIHGARVTGLVIGAVVVVVGMIPVLFVREGYRKLAARSHRLPFFQGIRETFFNKSFLVLSLIATGNKMSGAVIQTMGIYIIIYQVYGGDVKAAAVLAGIWGTVYQATTLLTIPVVTWMATHWGKISALRVCLWALLAGVVSTWFTYRPDLPYLVLLTAVILGPGQTAFYAVVRSLIGDICDEDELRTGLRREGMYASMEAWVEKAMWSLALVLTGVVLETVGFNRDGAGPQSAHTLLSMRLAFLLIPMGGVALALLALRHFPLTEARCLETRRELERRRGTPHTA